LGDNFAEVLRLSRLFSNAHPVERGRTSLAPLVHHLADHGLGSISEIFEGNPHFTPRGCIAQAWGVGEMLQAWQEILNTEARK
jgi:glycogen debranching enzyme